MNNKDIKPAIVISAYNRPESLERILGSIYRANYSNYDDIYLVISIDGGGSEFEKVCKIADKFNWKNGKKIVIKHSKNLGLRSHIISCGNLAQKYGAIILLEDDIFVSRNFYQYAAEGLNFYRDDKKIAGISLYSFEFNENAGLPFKPIIDGFDVYFLQVPCSWGQAWTMEQWAKFREFYDSNSSISSSDDLPENVKDWPENSWKKFFYKYIIEKHLYFVCPTYSFSTNFGDIGVHYPKNTQVLQTSLEYRPALEDFKFASFEESLNKYDAYFEVDAGSLIELGVNIDKDTCVDLYGTKKLKLIGEKYLLSSKECSNPDFSFGKSLQIILNNILYLVKGGEINYGKTKYFSEDKRTAMYTRRIFLDKIYHLIEYDKSIEQITSLKTKLASTESQLASTKFQLTSNKIALDLIKAELQGVYSSRGVKLALMFQKIAKYLLPKNSLS
jgi:hypothetical protein